MAGAFRPKEPAHATLPPVRVLETHVVQVFQNLIANSLKYRRKDHRPIIRVSVQQSGSHHTFSVADNGIGIPEAHQPKIFEIFHRLDPEATQGEGLGLTIAQRVLERQRGKICVESTEGLGSTFYVSLPVG